MKKNQHGGGSRTNENGLRFEQVTSLNEALVREGFTVAGGDVFDAEGALVGHSLPKHDVYKFLEAQGIDYRKYNAKKWLPDECFINVREKTAYVIEKKFQSSSGSVDEKLPSCEFKKREYEKLFSPIGYKVEYIYVFNEWFKDARYRDVLGYIREKKCEYYYEVIPFDVLGID